VSCGRPSATSSAIFPEQGGRALGALAVKEITDCDYTVQIQGEREIVWSGGR
jgi:hypothetical protein